MSSIIRCPVCDGDSYVEKSDPQSGEAYAVTCPIAEHHGPRANVEGGCRDGQLVLPLSPALVEMVIDRDEGELAELYIRPVDDIPAAVLSDGRPGRLELRVQPMKRNWSRKVW